MKPNFALSLSTEGITLLHRARDGWRLVGEAKLDAVDLSGALSRLRSMALRLSDGPLRTKVVIPNDQIRYMTIETGALGDTQRTAAIEASLDGATPYELDELVYDWAVAGEQTQIAALARETLDEAEAFAAQHGFNPVSLVARPERARFVGEPFFGPTALSRSLLDASDRVEPDVQSITVVGHATVPDADAGPDEAPAGPDKGPEARVAAAPVPSEPRPAPEAAAPAPVDIAALADADLEEETAEGEDTNADAEVYPALEPGEPLIAPPMFRARRGDDLDPGDGAARDPEQRDAAPPVVGQARDASAVMDPLPRFDPAATAEDADAAPVFRRRAEDRGAKAAPGPAGAPVFSRRAADRTAPAASPAATGAADSAAGFRVRADRDRPGLGAPVLDGVRRSAHSGHEGAPHVTAGTIDLGDVDMPPAPRIGAPDAAPDTYPALEPGDEDVFQSRAAPRPDTTSFAASRSLGEDRAHPDEGSEADLPGDGLARNGLLGMLAGRRQRAAEDAEQRRRVATAERLAREAADAQGAGSGRSAPSPRAPLAAPPSQASARRAEEEQLTMFGARPSQRSDRSPYLGLVLTAILIVFMAGVAAWASIFLSDEVSSVLRRADPAQSVADAAEATRAADMASGAATGGATAVTVPEDGATDDTAMAEAEADAADSGDPTGTPAASDTIDLALARTDPQAQAQRPPRALLPQPRLEPLPERRRDEIARPRAVPPTIEAPSAETEQRYALTGVWIEAPFAAPAPIAGTVDDVYLASIDPAVPNLDAVALPVPGAGRDDAAPRAQFDPAPAGTRFQLNARGFVVPEQDGAMNPDGVLVFAGPPAKRPPDRPAETLQSLNAEVVAQLMGKRPKLRPEGLVAQNERMRLGGYSRDELATKRPRLRPEGAAPAEVAATAGAPTGASEGGAAAGASTAGLSGVDTAAVEAAVGQALAALDPAPEDAVAGGTAQAVAISRRPSARPGSFSSTVEQAQAAAIRPVAVVAPRQTVAPSVPSSASVTRSATVRNAINLNQINLIGVYGQPSSRRALLRMSDGRYRKVKVGDSLDGGRVSAIGDGELQYTKGGRAHVLQMPRG